MPAGRSKENAVNERGSIKAVVNVARDFGEAEEWDIRQQVSMSPDERQQIAKELRERCFGTDSPDVRDVHRP
jgi:hypothetical protein